MSDTNSKPVQTTTKGTNNMLIPTKEKTTSALITDALRILTWKQWKTENEQRGLDGYENFKNDWKSHEIHKMNLDKLQEFIKELGYSQKELMEIRDEYYANKPHDNKSNSLENISW